MPPVLGPRSPSCDRLKSCATGSACADDAVADREDRDLRPVEQLLDHDRAGEAVELRQPRLDLGLRLADDDALARGEPVRLEHARSHRLGERCRHRHARRHHDRLGEGLRALDRGCSTRRAEDGEPRPTGARRRALPRAAPPARRRRARCRARARDRARPLRRPPARGGIARERRCRDCRERRGARRAAATGRASRRARARGHRIRRGARAPSESTECYGSVSTASRPCPVPTSETGTPRASSTKRT